MNEKKSVDVGNVWWFWFTTNAFAVDKRLRRVMRMLPHDPRCKFCNTPFRGIGAMNPRYCNLCEIASREFPGGAEVPDRHPKETDTLTFSFVTEGIEIAIGRAKAAVGDKEVTVIGAASTARQCLKAGLADELHVDIMPVLPGDGRRLFEDTHAKQIQLERLAVMELPGGRTHLEFRIIK